MKALCNCNTLMTGTLSRLVRPYRISRFDCDIYQENTSPANNRGKQTSSAGLDIGSFTVSILVKRLMLISTFILLRMRIHPSINVCTSVVSLHGVGQAERLWLSHLTDCGVMKGRSCSGTPAAARWRRASEGAV